MTLTDFLLARIAEDEGVAEAVVAREVVVLDRLSANPERGWPHDPARVLAECEAKRRIVTQVVDLDRQDGYTEATRDAVRALAAAYADHPDYQQEWKP